MATEQNFQYDTEDNKKKNQTSTLGMGGAPVSAPQTSTGPAPGQAPASQPKTVPGAPAAQAKPQQRGTGRAFNLQRYQQANPEAAKKLAGSVSQYGQEKVGEQLGQTQEQLQQFRQGAQQAGQRFGQLSGLIGQVKKDPTKLSGEDIATFGRLRTGDLSDVEALKAQSQDIYGAYQKGAKTAEELAGLTQTEQGRFQLLGQALQPGIKDYTTGERALDQLFFQTGGGAEQVSQSLGGLAKAKQEELAGLQQELGSQLGGYETQAQQAQSQIAETLGGFKEGSGGVLGDFYGELAKQRSAAEKQQQQEAKRLQNLLSGKQGIGLGSEELSALGLDPELYKMQQEVAGIQQYFDQSQGTEGYLDDVVREIELGEQLYGGNVNLGSIGSGTLLNLGEYLTPQQQAALQKQVRLGDEDVTFADVISPEQQARLNALAQISGQERIGIGSKSGGELGATFGGAQDLNEILRTSLQSQREQWRDKLAAQLRGLRNYRLQTEAANEAQRRGRVKQFFK